MHDKDDESTRLPYRERQLADGTRVLRYRHRQRRVTAYPDGDFCVDLLHADSGGHDGRSVMYYYAERDTLRVRNGHGGSGGHCASFTSRIAAASAEDDDDGDDDDDAGAEERRTDADNDSACGGFRANARNNDVYAFKDGQVQQVFGDGSRQTYFPSGVVLYQQRDGEAWSLYPSGAVRHRLPSGIELLDAGSTDDDAEEVEVEVEMEEMEEMEAEDEEADDGRLGVALNKENHFG